MRLVLRATGPAAAATAWERYADLRAWSRWSPQIAAVVPDDGPSTDDPAHHGPVDGSAAGGALRLRAGLTGRVLGARVRRRPLLVVTFVVEDVDPVSRRWTWAVVPRRAVLRVPEAAGRWARLHLVHAVLATSSGGAATTLELRGAAPVVLGYAAPAWLALRRLVR